jgi:S1/P1 Nuclease
MRFLGLARVSSVIVMLPLLVVQPAFGWGHDGHSMINRIAVATLPADVPEFLRSKAAQEAMDYYAPHPDDWRNEEPKEALYATLVPEHDIDLEWADLAGPLPRYRYEYMAALQAAQAAHPDVKLTAQSVGLLPYSTFEHYEMLKSAMRDYRKAIAAKQDTKAAEAEIVVLAGILGHFVGDGSQPLHVTYRYNGWTGPNPNGYATDHGTHARFEGDYVHNNIKASDFAPLVEASKPTVLADPFEDFVKYLRHSNSLVEKTYQLDKAGAFTGAGTAAGKEFTDERLAAGAIELRDMIYTAWVRSADPLPVFKGN